MSLPSASFAPPIRPRLRHLEADDLPFCVAPLGLLMCLEGGLVVHRTGDALRLHGGELLVLRRGRPLELGRTEGPQRLALFEASRSWVDSFWALHGADPDADRHRAEIERLPAGTPLGRRAADLLTSAVREPGRPLSVSRVAALLELALEAPPSLLAGRSSGQQPASQRRALIRALADYDPEAVGDFSLHGLAERVGLSSRQTARLVRGETGRSFRELKTAARIERARKLLASSDFSILEVALRAGWNSASQFHEAFRQSVGVTPARYREAHRG